MKNTFKVDGYVRWDSEVRWRLKTNSELSVSIQNIADKDYVSYIGGRDFARFGEPRTWRVAFLHHW
ncbi:TonB-dependent receptor [Vibrio metschnikovii]|uniref:TonB-dependent receptor n=1 Tax=Vibrio metschnikovii TaxID=28172 RepID=UPI001C306D1D|nr:TonB-dependent receptor [Vibrio metschnikovii]